MLDFETITETKKERYKPFLLEKCIELKAGDKIASDTEILAIANKTVSSGFKARVGVRISITLEKL